jgi:hypothetical protein
MPTNWEYTVTTIFCLFLPLRLLTCSPAFACLPAFASSPASLLSAALTFLHLPEETEPGGGIAPDNSKVKVEGIAPDSSKVEVEGIALYISKVKVERMTPDRSKVEIEGIVYPTSEHAFQAMKTLNQEERKYI